MAIGCGFGQRDLAAVRVGQVDKTSYDLRRGKTGIERYGDTPLPGLERQSKQYLKQTKRSTGDLMFITVKGCPLVHGKSTRSIMVDEARQTAWGTLRWHGRLLHASPPWGN